MARLEMMTAVSIMCIIFVCPEVSSETEEVKQALVQFLEKLSPQGNQNQGSFGWNSSSDPCRDKWEGVDCDGSSQSVRKIVLNKLNLTGSFDAGLLCVTSSLFVLSLQDNNIGGGVSEEILHCKSLRHVYLNGNNFSGNLPRSLSMLSSLKRLDISNNEFSGQLPDMSRLSGLLTFRAQFNQFTGKIPSFEFTNLEEFNVSYNNLSGQIPDVSNHLNASSFLGNPGLCGKPLPNACPIPRTAPNRSSSSSSVKQYLIYCGYAILGLMIVVLFALRIIKRETKKEKAVETHKSSSGSVSRESRTGGNRSEYSVTSSESARDSSFVILTNQIVSELRFEDMLGAPAELMGKGKHGSTYKVTLAEGKILAVKRIKDWEISKDEFEKRMQRIDQVKHENVMPAVGYYCSKMEKLLVYEYQQNGSLFSHLQESKKGQLFDWESRLNMAASIAEALAFMHERLGNEGIAHGNLKSTNIFLNKNMDPCISEYGLMEIDNQAGKSSGESLSENSFKSNDDPAIRYFKADIYGFGVILLELLTGRHVQNSGFDLAKWVHSVIREEWTVEVFDKKLISEGASEARMVNLLQVALKCLNATPVSRPNMRQVTTMIISIKDDEDNSMGSDL